MGNSSTYETSKDRFSICTFSKFSYEVFWVSRGYLIVFLKPNHAYLELIFCLPTKKFNDFCPLLILKM